ncbi:bifunctional 3'-5' exonuclease/DNA polymerase [Curtobacterium sp. MCPF17_052]|uniref:bifunctional 3'-5' exonuclease/DNA polymerase n=1 Tax=Curtobacterium sp. MCPF17_052 TaxID=2175655 RepID=UPI0024DF4CE8|nr:bifunctional 3'-5' exonuclease/DNA polymerase [Curtobacterium sp. MCPF17_052]WIB13786.1 bifunctional 3'-5' exonuclease/DNA polymerase [Curtobacterium sp. MCPF17_052]
MHIVLARVDGGLTATPLTDAGTSDGEPVRLTESGLPAFVAAHEGPGVRWVWSDTARWYPAVLAAGGRVARCVDLRLGHRLLRTALATRGSALAQAPLSAWDAAVALEARPAPATQASLFDDDLFTVAPADDDLDPVVELRAQLDAVAGASEPGALRLLLAAESAGALVAAEIKYAGLPWRTDVHERLLADALGPRVPYGVRPRKLEELAAVLRQRLDDPDLNPDSPADVLRSLRRAGLVVDSTRKWELERLEHPAIEPLLEYKRLYRLLTANGWTWLDEWVQDGRFHPEYVVGGVVTGRWAANGGGALQLPKQVRGAVVADPGWELVVADAAQLEPRVLAAMSGDTDMAAAGDGQDLYDGVVASGAVQTRQQAKMAMLGAMYGATQGEGGRFVPRLARAFPRALDLVEQAARAGGTGRTRDDPARSDVAGAGAVVVRGAEPGVLRGRHPPRCSGPSSPGPAAGDGSHGTSWCRARRPSGRCPGWAACAPDWPRGATGPSRPGRTWSSSCTTNSWCTHRPRTPSGWPSRSGPRRSTPGGSCSVASRSLSR